MTELNIEILKTIVEKIPDDFTVEYARGGVSRPICDKVEVDLSGKKLILKS